MHKKAFLKISKKSFLQHANAAASKCRTSLDFQTKHLFFYITAKRLGLLQQVQSSLDKRRGNRTKRFLYAFEFKDKSVYVGLTYNLERRLNQHLASKTHVGDKIRTTKYRFVSTRKEYDQYKAAELEAKNIVSYEKRGWKILNRKAPGGLGNNQKRVPKSQILRVARSCKDMKEFREEHRKTYKIADNYGLLPEIRKIVPLARRANGFFNNKKNFDATLKQYRMLSRQQFRQKCNLMFEAAKENGWGKDLDRLFPRTYKVPRKYRKRLK